MDLSTLIKIAVGFINFVIAAFLIKNEFSKIKLKRKVSPNGIYIILLIVIMILTTVYTIIDGYDANKSSIQIQNMNNSLNTMTSELNVAKNDRDTILNNLVSSNVKLKEIQNKLDPFLSIALKKYPNTDTTEALRKLFNEIDKIKKDIVEVSLQAEFKPIIQSVKEQILTELRKSVTLQNSQFLINDWSGKPVNQLVAKEIGDIIRSSGLSSELQNSFGAQGGYIPPPIEINVEPDNVNAYTEFVRIFKPLFFDYQPKLRVKKGMGNILRVRIFGSPSFKMDGRIKYQ
ncbi:MAG: hypothetical protein A2455_07330 [Ignavibacteria bacterium RIFOXYC2_FULL_35_16]|nr:MAG: hypothetical protein A2X60_07340 [Ignavibacteria bacterium GWF2_35_20]OGU84525.1 MAG: hypothetical protein A3K31_08865 [Ignavibacteria bacterium RIFOXYA12_FULL_35_25]OGU92049.1 MAG: hypothetical protein A2492_01325 [Ignavibacteria bacterium RIFOXYC12_FULL_35_11]OGU95645.1 MAG: hypothetical protein A2347_00405 [Ignavibacteria bacterium RIFOXYB12_FULL_35_14]OGU99099.1 MAG: hypothetical protein A2455_07330 [Ignavibacteria bacterium RIFOXYC2_FULL_35_16]OGV33016.1 MAG: hypothetical protein 